jgi:hypothetical protein
MSLLIFVGFQAGSPDGRASMRHGMSLLYASQAAPTAPGLTLLHAGRERKSLTFRAAHCHVNEITRR